MATVGRRSEPLTCDYELNWLWLVSRQFVTPTIMTVFCLKILACLLAKNFRSEATSFLTNTDLYFVGISQIMKTLMQRAYVLA